MRQYDPLQVSGSFAGPAFGAIDIVDGGIAGDFIASALDNPLWTREFDRHGNATRVKNNNRGGTVTVMISASSPTNAGLSGLQIRDRLGEAIVGTLLIRDNNGGSVIICNGAFINSTPAPTFGVTRGERAWVFECETIDIVLAGHDPV